MKIWLIEDKAGKQKKKQRKTTVNRKYKLTFTGNYPQPPNK